MNAFQLACISELSGGAEHFGEFAICELASIFAGLCKRFICLSFLILFYLAERDPASQDDE